MVITSEAVDAQLNAYYEYSVVGQMRRTPTVTDKTFLDKLVGMSKQFDFPVVSGKTMSTADFYEGTVY